MARQFLPSTSDTAVAECKHLSLVVEGLEAGLRIANLTRIVDMINDAKQVDVLPMRIDAVDVRLTLQVSALCRSFQGDHLSGKPGNVREFETCQGNVRDVVNSQGNIRGKILSGKSVPKLFISMHIY